jgi:uncharacterized protein YndB with AHSA1/START domain
VPTVRRARTIRASSQAIWDVIADPAQFPRWWPDVVRVEDASAVAWTKVLSTPKGTSVRADFTRLTAEEPRRIAWEQEIEESPFERILSENKTEVQLEPEDDNSTRVRLESVQHLRGYSRFGGFLFRRATRRKLEEALDGLERAVAEES